MKITRINEFRAKEGQLDALLRQLKISVPQIQASAGCLSCRALQHEDEPHRLVIIEEWINEEAHVAAVKSIPLAVLKETMTLVTEPPYGENYRDLDFGAVKR